LRHGERGTSTTAMRSGVRALAGCLAAGSAALALAPSGRAEDAATPPAPVPTPAAGMSALIMPDAPDDSSAPAVPAATEAPPATDSAVVTAVAADLQENAANAAVSAIVRQPAAHPVAEHPRVISPRAQSEPSHATRPAAPPVRRAVREVRFGWYQVHVRRYHGAGHARRGPPAHAGLSTRPRSPGDRVASDPERSTNDGQICLPDSSFCVDSCPLNQPENVLQNGDWIVACIFLPSLPDEGVATQPTPTEPTAPAEPAPQYQCSDAQYHELCCELTLELSLPVPGNCADVFSAPVSGADDGVIPVPSAPSSQPAAAPPAPAAVGSSAAPAPDVVRPPAAPDQKAPPDQYGWELAVPEAAPAAAVENVAPPEPKTPTLRVRTAAKATVHPSHLHPSSSPQSTAPREVRSAAPAPRVSSPASTTSDSLLGWFLITAGLVLLVALATVSGLDGATAAVLTGVRSRLGSRGLSVRPRRRARRGIRYRD
jgi:hypothetical protein